jgi:hypothetical protein
MDEKWRGGVLTRIFRIVDVDFGEFPLPALR